MPQFGSELAGTLKAFFGIGAIVLRDVTGRVRVESEGGALVPVQAAPAGAPDDVITSVDVGGSLGLPVLDGSQLTGLTALPADLDKIVTSLVTYTVVIDNAGNVVTSL